MTHLRKALVLGGLDGMLGQTLMRVLAEDGWEVEGTDRASIDYTAPDAGDRLKALAERTEPACIFNTVAYTQVENAEDHPDDADLLNRAVPLMAGRTAGSFGCALIHYSTDFVFNGKKDSPYTEEDAPDPQSVYGRTKLAGEDALLSLSLKNCAVIRTAWLFGPGKANFVHTILERCRGKKTLNVVHDQVGSPTYTLDLAQYSLKLVDAGGAGLFHIVNAGRASWCDLATEAARLAQRECLINAVPSSAYPQKAARPAFSVLDTSAFARATGIAPRPWPQALQDYVFRAFPAEEA
ncbi:MAG: dTDP-4-dehydrorhamnose reductase [Desulfovibrio sp.]|jgi:dTDP-4-dehydrorhamnose reductase|nr:dTDP-4-dehydrorhamnose reductase [Desulfovibrio sp.]